MGIFKKFDDFKLLENYTEPQVTETEGEEEEEDSYIGTKLLKDLAKALDVQYMGGNSITFEGQKISFFSETEKFHIKGKKFTTVGEVVNFLREDKVENVEEETREEELVEENNLTKKFKDFK